MAFLIIEYTQKISDMQEKKRRNWKKKREVVAAQWRATPTTLYWRHEKSHSYQKKKKTAEVLLKKGNIYVGTSEKKDWKFEISEAFLSWASIKKKSNTFIAMQSYYYLS